MTDKTEICDCPYCKEEIKVDAVKCKHCGSNIKHEKTSHEGICPFCKEDIHPDAIKCKHCKSVLVGETNCANCNNEQISPTQSQLMAALNLGVPSFGGGGSFNTKPDKKPVKVCFWAPKFTCTPDPSSPWGVDKCTSEIVEICIEV